MSRNAPPEERFWRFVAKSSDGCWEWMGARGGKGYGTFWVGSGKFANAHRWAYSHFVGPIADGLQLDHLCRNRACVRPDHLEPVTASVNVLRSYAARRAA